MFKSLRLEQFKNFGNAELKLGPFTLLVGANASGKSNIRDAFRFLHGIGRGYTLAEIFGEKWGEGGERLWNGIRGGAREVAFADGPSFKVSCTFPPPSSDPSPDLRYAIEVRRHSGSQPLFVTSERLWLDNQLESVFAIKNLEGPETVFPTHNRCFVWSPQRSLTVSNAQPTLSQLTRLTDQPQPQATIKSVVDSLGSMRFLDLHPEAMRRSCFPGQTTLGDQGENLSAVLQAICADPDKKQGLLGWLEQLTPMDVVDLKFPTDQIGRILVTLVEQDGPEISAYSASDGTLRFLGLLAALLGPNPPHFIFLEELENGIHPSRLHLLLDLIENQTRPREGHPEVQIVATTHSPFLLSLLQPEQREYASLVYRLPHKGEARIRPVMDIPEIRKVLEEQDLARLHASGWLENVVEFMEETEVPA